MKKILTAFCLLISLSGFANIIYVNDNATGANNGTSWTDAFTKLQDALAAAVSGDQLWVAAGIYYPDEGVGFTNNSLLHSFFLKNGVAIYGGFAGTETQRSQRNVAANLTVMSGDIDQVAGNAANAYTVVVGSAVNNSTILDGFTITAGNNSVGSGGGMFNNSNSSPTISNCSFTGNSANQNGGGMLNGESSPTLTNCSFTGNTAGNLGGGIYNRNGSSPTLTNCSFSENTAEDGGGMNNDDFSSPSLSNCSFSANKAFYGGGIKNSESSPNLSNCSFTGNTASQRGGGVYNVANSSPVFTDCSFSSNVAEADNGGGMWNGESSPTLTNCIFTGNTTSQSGGGIYNRNGSSPTLTDCSFSENTAEDGGGMNNDDFSSPNLTNCSFSLNKASYGGGIKNSESSSNLSNCSFTGNTASQRGGGVYNAGNSSPVFTDCSFSSNVAEADNGGGMWNGESSPTLTNCIFTGNTTSQSGGGIYNRNGSSPTLTDCSFSENTAEDGGGMNNDDFSSPSLSNCSFSANKASYGGGIKNSESSPNLSNCSFTGNTTFQRGGGVYNVGNSLPVFTDCSFSSNVAEADNGGGMWNGESSPTLTNCRFTGNTAGNFGGGIYNRNGSSPALTDCSFSENAANEGGGMNNDDFSSPNLTNCSFSLNKASYGGGIKNVESSPNLSNCSFSGNTANSGGGIYNSTSSLSTLTNCILWGDSNGEIVNGGGSSSVVNYSIIQGGHAGTGNLDTNPFFVDVADNNLRLKPCSPAINTGDNSAVTSATDLDGNPRIVETIVDRGAYEFQNCVPDITAITVNPVSLWPPNHTMRNIALEYTLGINCINSPHLTPVVSSNEPVNGTGDGDTDPDWEVVNGQLIKLRAERAANGNGRIYTIGVTLGEGCPVEASTEVRVSHNISGPLSGKAFKIGTIVDLFGEFWDKPGNKHTAKWLIDGSSVKGNVTEPTTNKNGKVTGSYKFTTPGVYKLQMNVTDQNGVTSYAKTNGDLEAIVVIYDPNGGHTYGGGYFNSPVGALTSNSLAIGKASYGFAMNYFKNSTYPKGEAQFEFKVGDFEFNALNFDYLVISNSMAQFKGTGKIIGGQSGVGFTMTVVDGELDGTGVDKIRMKIYNKNNGKAIYDNQPGASDAVPPVQAVGTNSTVVISGTNSSLTSPNTNQKAEMETSAPEISNGLDVIVFPNPSATSFTINVKSNSTKEKITMQVIDVYGRVIETRNFNAASLVKFGDRYRPGVYYVRVLQGKQQEEVKLIKLLD